MTDLIIERVDAANIQDFFGLLGRLAAYERLDPPDAEAQKRLASDTLQDPPVFEAYIGKTDGHAVGFVTFYFTYSTFMARHILFIEDIFVIDKERGKGYGTRLFEFCRQVARRRGCGCMDWMVLDWNEPSIHFYEKLGAERRQWYTYRLSKDRL